MSNGFENWNYWDPSLGGAAAQAYQQRANAQAQQNAARQAQAYAGSGAANFQQVEPWFKREYFQVVLVFQRASAAGWKIKIESRLDGSWGWTWRNHPWGSLPQVFIGTTSAYTKQVALVLAIEHLASVAQF